MEFKDSWLVQRLERGLTEEAMGLLRGIFAFDYMGAAEFEFGAVPKALQRIAKADLTAFEFEVDGRTVYALAPIEWRVEVEIRVRELARAHGPGYYQLKEPTHLHDVLHDGPYTDRLAGWLELDNGFLFFTDETMWRATCGLFGVGVASPETTT